VQETHFFQFGLELLLLRDLASFHVFERQHVLLVVVFQILQLVYQTGEALRTFLVSMTFIIGAIRKLISLLRA